MRHNFAALLSIVTSGVTACSSSPMLGDAGGTGSDADARPSADAPPGVITPAPAGVAIGKAITATIDPDGTNVTSSDGVLELDFPAGAVAIPTDVTITPITDTAPLGIAYGYRVEPANLALAQPANVVFHLPTASAETGDLGALFVATQDAQGYWNAIGAATWSDGAQTASASQVLARPGDLALASCLGLTTDEDLAQSAPAHLAVLRQCDAAPSSGRVGGAVAAADPVAWTTQYGTLATSGSTATLTAPPSPPSGVPITIVTATVSPSALGPHAAPPSPVPLQQPIAVASYAMWTVDGQQFVAAMGSSVISGQGKSAVNAADLTHSGTLSIGFDGETLGTYTATGVNAQAGQDAYHDGYQDPCTAAVEHVDTELDITNASTDTHSMSGHFSGQVAVYRGTKQCPNGPVTDVAIVAIDGAFNLGWAGPQ